VRVVRTMIRLGKAVTLVSLLCATIFSGPVVARHHSPKSLSEKRLEAVKLRETSARQVGAGNHPRRATETSTPSGVKNITFSNPKASGAYARVHALFVFFTHCGQSFTWMVQLFPRWTLMLAHHGPV
jgi:hypothetical protein